MCSLSLYSSTPLTGITLEFLRSTHRVLYSPFGPTPSPVSLCHATSLFKSVVQDVGISGVPGINWCFHFRLQRLVSYCLFCPVASMLNLPTIFFKTWLLGLLPSKALPVLSPASLSSWHLPTHTVGRVAVPSEMSHYVFNENITK
jgi:hypothetical protein